MRLSASRILCFPLLAGAWTIIPDTDFVGTIPYHKKAASASACADICQTSVKNCVAISWNGPQSRINNSMCNFKCSSASPTFNKGEEAVIVQPGADTCGGGHPTPPPAPLQCPADWKHGRDTGNLLVAHYNESNAQIGNGYIAMMLQENTEHMT